MRLLHVLAAVIALTPLAFPDPVLARQVQLSQVAAGLSSPVFVTHAGDSRHRLFIAELPGVIKVLQPGSSTPTVFLDIRSKVVSGGEQGLLGLAFHPQYLSNGRFFVFYTRGGDGALVLAEYLASPSGSNSAGPTEKVILRILHPTYTNHNGGMLAFGPDGFLYIGVGDGGGGNDPFNNAQNKSSLLGKILRLDVNAPGVPYAVPADNPFAGAIEGADEIFAYGFRNPWRFSFDETTGQQWVGDVGQGAREEVDTPVVSGGNYGWRVFEGSACTGIDSASCSSPNAYLPPAFEYAHGTGRCSLTGGYVYRGRQGTLPQGLYVYGDYCSGEILGWNGTSQSLLLAAGLRISSFGEDEAGEIYVVNLGGTVSRIVRAAACTYSISPTRVTVGAAGLNGTVTVTAGSGCPWSAGSQSSWISVTGGSDGFGNGTVTYSVAPYTGRPKNRTGAITIAGQTFTVKQSK